VCNATVNNISVISRRTALLVEKTRVHRENHRPIIGTLSHNEDVYTHNGGVHVHWILIFFKYSQNDR
jgi:hypothetical protein